MFKAFCWLVLILGVAFGGLTYFPGIFFKAKKEFRNITVYSHEPLKDTAEEVMLRVNDKVFAAELADSGQKFEVYLDNGSFEYKLFSLFCKADYACLNPLTGKVFVASADFDKKKAFTSADTEKGRPLDAVLIRALAKGQVKKKVSDLAYFFLSDWRKDGYAEHVAMETDGWDNVEICGDKAKDDPVRRGMKYRLTVEMVTSEDRLTYEVMMKENYSPESVEKRVMKKYCQ